MEGLAGVSRVVARAADKKFEVQFDPARVTPEQLLDAVQKLGYRPSVEGAIGAAADTSATSIEARASAAGYRAGSDGAVIVKLKPKPGVRLGGDGQVATKIVVVGTDAVTAENGEASLAEAVTAGREVRIPIRIAEGVRAGPQTVTVRVTFQARKGDASQAEQTVELRVPVVVQ